MKNSNNLFTHVILAAALLLCLTSCAWQPISSEYRQFYAHLNELKNCNIEMTETDYYLVILVDARHLAYCDNRLFFKTLAKHPSDGSKNGDVGHAWIYLHGYDNNNGTELIIEGGHSGERGVLQAKYFDGIMNYIDFGYANPTTLEKDNYRYEANPIKYLWETKNDGFFECGPGSHKPTYAAKIDLTKDQFKQILAFINPRNYSYHNYSLTQWQCTSYVVRIAALVGWILESQITVPIESRCYFGGTNLRLWDDPCYSSITFCSPDVLEKSLMRAVQSGRAQYALSWYLKKRKASCIDRN